MSNGLACAKCFKFMRVKKIGIGVEEGMPEFGGWRPYKLWMADLCECPDCGAQMIAGFGSGPIAEHWQAEYERLAKVFSPIGRIDDCGGKRP
jgi:hypothetical protein